MLDTNICIYLLKNHPASVSKRFSMHRVGDVVMSAITFAELSYGAEASPNRETEQRSLDRLAQVIPVLPFDAQSARAYGAVRFATRDRMGRDQLDKLIAAHAISFDLVLVTHNVRDFQAYNGLVIENWLEQQL
ncbi:type II toxin-antitoxin system VapC family toxin [Xaviernesmea oryzae]|nr:type II toxin-antitoxin system VapC family toxin [Xaviernesmea oryzae]